MVWVAAGLLALPLVLGGALLFPMWLRAEVGSDPPRLRLQVQLFAGLVRLTPLDTDRPRRPHEPALRRRRRSALRRRRAPLGQQRLLLLLRAGLEAVGFLRIEMLQGELCFALGDPALTGEAYGRLAGLQAMIPAARCVRLMPQFHGQRLSAEGEAAVAFVPARLIPLALRLARDWRKAPA